MTKIGALLFFMLMLGICRETSIADTTQQQVGVDEKLGETIPLDLSFLDETGKPVTLRSLVNKPTLLTLVYYRCPGICSPLMNGVSEVVDKVDMQPGKDFNIVTISFNPREDYLMAAGKKENYLNNMKKKLPADSWKFLTGDSASIAKITDAVGFRYQQQGEDYIHGAVVTVLSQDGKIARYLYGTEFLPMDIKLAVIEASEGKSTPGINKLLKICYSYDPQGRKYVLNVTRIAGGGMLILIAGFVLILTLKRKKNKHNIPVNTNGKGSINNG
ncbi:MAG TPA: SCO family protein [Ignavibacteria bacterium]|nr:SCO family protein [Ignavibacteria bacterium]HRF64357.1 SCO family protein [Ignavibacteria bacterium]HRJ03870.1 SCO family protein [Ignavibacteria bacterium]HRJ84326.1 SCO family protein [Ignavibacteria bacterium]